MRINVNQHQVWCELHNGYVEYWKAMFVKEDNIKSQRPAEGNTLASNEYGACIDCLVEEIHPLLLETM